MMALASNCWTPRLVLQPSSVSSGLDQRLALGIDGALDQAQHAAQWAIDTFDAQHLFPQRYAFARARILPTRGGVGVEPLEQRCHVGGARVPLDQPVHLGKAGAVICFDLTHQVCRVKARVQPREDRRLGAGRAQALGHRDHPLRRLNSVSSAECCTPGRSASSRQNPCEPR